MWACVQQRPLTLREVLVTKSSCYSKILSRTQYRRIRHRGQLDESPKRMAWFCLPDYTPRAKLTGMVSLQYMLPYVQIGLSAILIVAILLQHTGASLGGAFGADNFSSGFHTRRGVERTLFRATIVLGILFAISALVSLVIS